MKNLKTNEDLVSDLMNFSPHGALCQAFITQAIEYYCDKVIENKEESLKEEAENEANGKLSIVSQKSWIGIAEDTKKRIREFYNPTPKTEEVQNG